MGWWYVEGDQRRGPFTEPEFSVLTDNGTIRPGTLVWRDGMPEWTHYERLIATGQTPENDGRPRFAGFWIRYIAKYLDGFFTGFATLFLALSYWLIAQRPFDDPDQIPYALLALFLIRTLVSGVYNVLFVGARGKTPGKMFVKLEIVRADGTPVSYGLALARWVVSGLNYFTLMIGWMMAGWSTEKTALHDRICGTRVFDHGSKVGGPAGFWIRYVAKSLDNILLTTPSMGIGMAIGFAFAIAGNEPRQDLMLIGRGIGTLIGYVLSFGYFTYFVGAYGATPGKMVLGLKVIRTDGEPVSYGRAAGRWGAALINYLTLYIGWIIAAFDERKRGLHDLICDTRVIHTR